MTYRCVSIQYGKEMCDVTVAVDRGDGKEMIFNVSVPMMSKSIDVHEFARFCVAMRLTGATDATVKSVQLDASIADSLIKKEG